MLRLEGRLTSVASSNSSSSRKENKRRFPLTSLDLAGGGLGDFVGEGDDFALPEDWGGGGVLGVADGLDIDFLALEGTLEGLLAWISVCNPRLVCTMLECLSTTRRFRSEILLVGRALVVGTNTAHVDVKRKNPNVQHKATIDLVLFM